MSKKVAKEAPPVGEVHAVMSSANTGQWGVGKMIAKQCEQAMSEAVNKALADGVPITDSYEIRRRMMAARQNVLDKVKAPA